MLNNPETRNEYNSLLKQVSLQKQTHNYVDESATLFSLNSDFSYDFVTNFYKRNCERCSGYFMLKKNDLNNLLSEINSGDNHKLEEFILTLECDSCSLKIDILVI